MTLQINDGWNWQQEDLQGDLKMGDPDFIQAIIDMVSNNDLEPDEIWASVMLDEGRGHLMSLEAPPTSTKVVGGKSLHRVGVLTVKDQIKGPIPLYIYAEKKILAELDSAIEPYP